jgi:hypothetical protein
MRPGGQIGSEREFFEFDRNILIGQLNVLQLTVRKTMTEIAMVAAENVFDKPLSAKLKRKARALDRIARRLDDLGKVLARAKFPPAKT